MSARAAAGPAPQPPMAQLSALAQRAWQRARRAPLLELLQLTVAVAVLIAMVTVVSVHSVRRHKQRRCRAPPFGDAVADEGGYTQPFYPQPTGFRDSAALARAPDGCAQTLQLPQVALLFLVRGELPHEELWRRWFQFAAQGLPRPALRAALCEGRAPVGDNPAARQAALEECAAVTAAGGVLDSQRLFDVWVHPLANFSGFQEGSVFAGRELPPSHRVPTEWGTHTLVDATRALLAAALTNPLASRFVLLSESDVPLYSPQALYLQLTGERRSRVNACNASGWDVHEGHRWREDVGAAGLPAHLWRKSWQWVALTRQHAELAVEDQQVDAIFRSSCRRRWDPHWCTHRICYPDEHYFPTLLAWHGADNESDCAGELTDRDWSRVPVGTPHPYEYPPEEVTPRLLSALRHPERPGCQHAEQAAASAAAAFVSLGQLLPEDEAGALCAAPSASAYLSLGPSCPLLARKFVDATAARVLAAMAPCSGILQPAVEPCPPAEDDAAAAGGQLSGEVQEQGRGLHWLFVVFVLVAGAALAGRWGVSRWVNKRRRLPISRNETFHTALKNRGMI